jgi:hypothetical protein
MEVQRRSGLANSVSSRLTDNAAGRALAQVILLPDCIDSLPATIRD